MDYALTGMQYGLLGCLTFVCHPLPALDVIAVRKLQDMLDRTAGWGNSLDYRKDSTATLIFLDLLGGTIHIQTRKIDLQVGATVGFAKVGQVFFDLA